jgi:hypothetical protein
VVNDGPLSRVVLLSGPLLSGGKLLVVIAVGNCGVSSGGAAMVDPMLVQPLLVWGTVGVGFASTLRSTGVTGSDWSDQLEGVEAAGAELAGHPGGGATLLRVVALAAGAVDDVAKGFDG